MNHFPTEIKETTLDGVCTKDTENPVRVNDPITVQTMCRPAMSSVRLLVDV